VKENERSDASVAGVRRFSVVLGGLSSAKPCKTETEQKANIINNLQNLRLLNIPKRFIFFPFLFV